MAATMTDLTTWFDYGVEIGATHMVVVCDTYDYEDYPVYVDPSEDVHAVEGKFRAASMQKVMEVYNLSMSRDAQMRERRAFNY